MYTHVHSYIIYNIIYYAHAYLFTVNAGSAWTPRNPSGKTVLLFSLMFALVMYNAYAAFITSVLSVQANGIKSITDLLSHNFKLGYSITDDEYIRVSLFEERHNRTLVLFVNILFFMNLLYKYFFICF